MTATRRDYCSCGRPCIEHDDIDSDDPMSPRDWLKAISAIVVVGAWMMLCFVAACAVVYRLPNWALAALVAAMVVTMVAARWRELDHGPAGERADDEGGAGG